MTILFHKYFVILSTESAKLCAKVTLIFLISTADATIYQSYTIVAHKTRIIIDGQKKSFLKNLARFFGRFKKMY